MFARACEWIANLLVLRLFYMALKLWEYWESVKYPLSYFTRIAYHPVLLMCKIIEVFERNTLLSHEIFRLWCVSLVTWHLVSLFYYAVLFTWSILESNKIVKQTSVISSSSADSKNISWMWWLWDRVQNHFLHGRWALIRFTLQAIILEKGDMFWRFTILPS